MGKSKQELQRAGHIISSGTDECMYVPLLVDLGQSWFLHSYIVQGSLPHCLRNGATYSGLGLLISVNIHVLPYISTGHPDLDNTSTEAFFSSDSRLWKVGIPKPTSTPQLSKPHGLRGTPVATQMQTRCVPQWPNQVRKETFLWGGVTPVGFHVPASGKGECSRLVLWSLRQLCACYGLDVKHPSLASVLLNTWFLAGGTVWKAVEPFKSVALLAEVSHWEACLEVWKPCPASRQLSAFWLQQLHGQLPHASAVMPFLT